MESINDYLDNVYEEFQEYINSSDNLCELKNLHFDAGNLPDYSNIHIQQLYILRYTYAYAFEYKRMYKKLLQRLSSIDSKVLKVLSIGCGNIVDYWSLSQVIPKKCRIEYVGVDCIDWYNKFSRRKQDDVEFVKSGILEYFETKDAIDADVYIFPKSISEFSKSDIEEICNCIKPKCINKDEVHFLFSLRSDSGSLRRDMDNTEIIYEEMCSLGFYTHDKKDLYTTFSDDTKDRKIRKLDYDFQHPQKIVGLLKELHTCCGEYDSCYEECKDLLDRLPILSCKNINWQIFTFKKDDTKC